MEEYNGEASGLAEESPSRFSSHLQDSARRVLTAGLRASTKLSQLPIPDPFALYIECR